MDPAAPESSVTGVTCVCVLISHLNLIKHQFDDLDKVLV